MPFLRSIANIFINTFGITQPTPENRDRMARFIGFLLLAVFLSVTAVAWVLRALFHV